MKINLFGKRRAKSSILFALCLFCSNAAIAHTTGSYAGLQIGQSESNYTAKNQKLTPASVEDKGAAWRGFTGYQFNQNFAVEGGYIRYATVDFKNALGTNGATAEVEARAADLIGKFIYPLNAFADIYMKGGLAIIRVDKHANSAAKSAGARLSGETVARPTYGVGATYEFYPGIALEATWMRIPEGSKVEDTDYYGVGLTFFFG